MTYILMYWPTIVSFSLLLIYLYIDPFLDSQQIEIESKVNYKKL